MKFLLIGGDGFLGKGFINYLNSDDEYAVFDKGENLFSLSQSILADINPNLIVNLSVVVDFKDKGVDPESDYYRVNVDGLSHLLNLAKLNSIPLIQISTREVIGLRNWNLISSASTVGAIDIPKVSESEPCFPLHSYGKTKLIAEYIAQSYSLATIVRLNTCYTDDLKSNKGLIANLYNKVMSQGSIELTNKGAAVRDPMHVKDLVSIVKNILGKGAFGETFHAGGGNDNILSLRDMCLTFNEDVEIKNIEKEGLDLGFLMDVTKAYKNLDWRPSVNFKTWANTLSVK